jgi:hypothetical protein
MTDYRFVSTWHLQAPIKRVWEEIFHTERWPSWWKYVRRVEELDPGGATDSTDTSAWSSRPDCPIGSASTSRSAHPATHHLEAVATGELEGIGRWTLTPDDGVTLVRYTWDVWTTKWWMNLASPLARPLFIWTTTRSCARRPKAWQPARALARLGLVVLLALVVMRWRRRS